MHSTNRVLIFVAIMTTVVSLLLAFLFYSTEARVKINEEVYNKRATLSAIQTKLGKSLDEISNEEIISMFESSVKQMVVDGEGNEMSSDAIEALGYGGNTAEAVDMAKEKKKPVADRAWPVFEYTAADKQKYYIISVRGNGLWDEIWGYMALESDMKTVAGVAFDHKAETPGLGAEIKDNKGFQEQFIGTSIMNEAGEYEGILVRKGGAKNKKYEVDGLTGATITADGVTDMIAVGVEAYSSYLMATK